ncbi:MAG: hypothetical protein OHK0012_10240 [Synechococcales cyanobacterium]
MYSLPSYRKTIFSAGAALVGLVAALGLTSSVAVDRSYRRLETEFVGDHLERVISTFTDEQDSLDSTGRDWAEWDDTYQFMEDRSDRYISSNVTAAALTNFDLNLILFLNTSGEIIHAQSYDRETEAMQAIPPDLLSHLSARSLLLQNASEPTLEPGILLLDQDPLLIVARPILTSEAAGPSRGTLVVGRYLTESSVAALQDKLRLSLQVFRVDDPMLPPTERTILQSFLDPSAPELLDATEVSMLPPDTTIRVLDAQTIAGYALLRDIYGQPAVLLRVNMPRTVYQQGQRNKAYFSLVILVTIAIFGGLILAVVSADLRRRKTATEELQRLLQALHASEERYALAVKGATDGLWDWDLQSQTIYFSPRWKAMLGHPDQDISEHPQEWFDRVFPEDLIQLQAALQAHLDGHTEHFECEYRILARDGSYRWMLSRGLAVRGAAGKAHRMAGSQTDITARKDTERQLEHDALHDALTGLPNRTLLMSRLERAMQVVKRHPNYRFAVLFIDLDRFKVVNDSLGHRMGDQLLIATAQRLLSSLRGMDTIARLGGDEFAVLLEDIRDFSDAQRTVERLQKELEVPLMLEGIEFFISASIGIALSSPDYELPGDLLRDADIAMYRAKATGRAHYEIFDTAMHAQLMERLHLENDLRRAIERHELQVHFQPIVSLTHSKIVGFEALVRWPHPEWGLISPAKFLPIAEETGLILLIDAWVLRESCRQVREWQDVFPQHRDLTVSVNISSKGLWQPDFVPRISNLLQEMNFNPHCLKLEITEMVLMDKDDNVVTTTFRQLRELNVQLDIDDFGTGYSSLSRLTRFPIDALKIDRSFIQQMISDENSAEIVRAIIALAQNLNLEVIAEGLETEEQISRTRALGCDYGQGFFIAKALDPRAATAFLADCSPRWAATEMCSR